MKEPTILTSEERQRFFDLSEKLRCCLEFKLDELFQKNGFHSSLSKNYCFFNNLNSEKEFIQSIIGPKNDNKMFAHSACAAVKTWCGMYYDDRVSVLEKFYSGWKQLPGKSEFTSTIDIPYLFGQVFFVELAAILNDNQWIPIRQYAQQDFNLKIE